MEDEGDGTGINLGPELNSCRCLNLCETRLILTDLLCNTARRSPQAQEVLKKSHEYTVNFSKIKVRQAVLDLRSALEKHDLYEFEIASLVNLIPRTAAEARCLIPSLKRIKDSTLEQILEEIDSFRMFYQ